jgi:hypothetical protein
MTWIGKFGEWVSSYSVARLAYDLGVDDAQIGRWVRGDCAPTIWKAIAIVEVARGAGVNLGLEDIYAAHIERIRFPVSI